MQLNDRKIRILEAIINDYIQTAEPIGSRTIAKRYGLGISSATIRNEMSDLEEMGLIIQPHASAGRVPSDKGYRLYVDKLMQQKEFTENEVDVLQSHVINNIDHIDYLMQETARVIAALTNYTTVVTAPVSNELQIKQIQLIPVDEKSVALVIIDNVNEIKNSMLKLEKPIRFDVISEMSVVLNNVLKDTAVNEVDVDKLNDVAERFANNKDFFVAVIKSIIEKTGTGQRSHIYTSGVKNILAFPEFSNLDKARAIFQTLEEKDELVALLKQTGDNNIQILIGSENDMTQMKDCSIVKANYFLKNSAVGSIGIIGPTRMDYRQSISVLKGIVRSISDMIDFIDNT
ncbi:MAG: heat-inducible transcriptional repressor HrcA [Defluviitaleaceae bacterium]|nr:heat-inducible transcriptional repressor HrcA [Defluviitaleaceae bacterium]